MRRVLAAAFLLSLALGCSEGGTPRCRTVCETEARCAKEREENDTFRFDKGECVAACSALERDREGKKLVKKHVACVEKAGDDCEAVAACR